MDSSMPENCSAKTNNYRPCVKSHGRAASSMLPLRGEQQATRDSLG